MRIGLNPNKDSKLQRNDFFHQLVIPVYIPNQEGYFKNSLSVLKLHLESVFKTVHSHTFISVINNGCSEEVQLYLNDLYRENKINEIIHTHNIGKVNAILKGIIGHSFRYITISDCDVLFESNWQNATYEVFQAFKKAGVVGLTPTIKTSYNLTSNVLFENFFSKSMKFSKIRDEKTMQMFYKSVGNEEKFIKQKDKRYFILEKENTTACVGSGHYVATYRSDIFKVLNKNSQFKMSGDMKKHLDEKLLKFGFWRLTTLQNYAFHMGNHTEQWMYDKIDSLSGSSSAVLKDHKNAQKLSLVGHFWYITVPSQLFRIIRFRRFFEKIKYDKSA